MIQFRSIANMLMLATLLTACGGAPTAQVPSSAANSAAATAAATASAAPAPTDAPEPTEVSAATAPAAYPLTIENCGRTLRFETAPQRIVATFQNVAEALVALGAGEQIVGLYFGQVQDLPAGMEAAFADIPTLGSGAFPSREVVLNTRPDLVIAYGLESDFGGEQANVRAALEQAGVPIFGMDCEAAPVDTAARYYQRLRELGTVLGREAQAGTIAAEMQTRIAAVQRSVEGREPVRGVFYYAGEGPFTVYGSGIANELIEAAGGLNLFKSEASRFPQLGAEAITGADPAVLVWSDFGPLGAQYLPPDPLQFLFTTFSSTTAATNQRGGAVPGAGLYPGVRMAEAVEALAKLLHPDAYTTSGIAGYPLSIDNCGVALTFTRPPERVVSTALNGTELLLALELQDRIVGAISPGDRLLPAYRDRFASVEVIAEKAFPPPSREVIVAANPDLILSGYSDDYGETGFGTRESFQAAGVNTFLPRGACGDTPTTIDDTYADIELLGRIFDVPDRAAALVEQMRGEAHVAEPPAKPVRVFNYDSGEDAPFTTGRNGLLTDLIARAGGENIFADVEQAYFTAGWEEILERDPEVIVVTSSGATPVAGQIDAETQQKIEYLRSNAQLQTISAIRNNRVVVLDITSQVPSVRNGTAIATLARAFAQTSPAGAAR